LLRQFSIQDTGGTAKTIAYGIGLIREMLPHANDVKRQPVPASPHHRWFAVRRLDGCSGITANPSPCGAAVDLLVRHGGRNSVRNTGIYGAEHLHDPARGIAQKLAKNSSRASSGGRIHDAKRRDEQQPVAGQQGGRIDDDPRGSRSAPWPRAARRTWSPCTNTPRQ
jgi:altronate dehydratase